jgi:hypothetical protein
VPSAQVKISRCPKATWRTICASEFVASPPGRQFKAPSGTASTTAR